MATALNRIKGVAIRGFAPTLDQVLGAGAWQRVEERLDPSVREHLRGGTILPGGWYDIAWYQALYDATAGAGLLGANLAHQMGLVSTRNDLSRGIYRVLLKVLSPEFVIGRAGLIFNQYYEMGTLRVDEVSKGSARAHWQDCPGFTAEIWRDIAGGCEGALLAAGAKGVHLSIARGGGNRDREMLVAATWQ